MKCPETGHIRTICKERNLIMKKLTAVSLALLLLLSALTGCASKTSAPIDMELTDLVDRIYEEKDPGLGLMTMSVDLSDPDQLLYCTGLASADRISEAVVSEPAISSQAYSLVLVRVKDAADAKAVAEEMAAGVNPAKWICVEADDLRTAACGDVVLLIMVSSTLSITADEIVNAFEAACGRPLDLK